MISVIIPAFNEEKRIEKTISAIYEEMEKGKEPYEILVVNDGSEDGTAALVKSLENGHIRLLSYSENKGKGAAIQYGVKFAAGQFIIFTDADLAYDPKNIPLAAEMLAEGYDIVMGSREENKSGKYPFHRKVMSGVFNQFVKFHLGIKEKDTQCGFKGFRYAAAQKIFENLTLSGWGFDVEMVFLANQLGYSIGRLPVKLNHNQKGSKIKIIADSKAMISDVLKIKKNNQKGVYKNL